MRTVLIVCGCALLACAAPAAAQYREGVPNTLAPRPTEPDPRTIVSNVFRAAYASRSSPRVVLLWNRAFSDEVASSYEDRTRITSRNLEKESELEEQSASDLGTSKLRERNQLDKSVVDIVSGAKRVETKRPALAERSDWRIEQAFRRMLVDNGMNFGDRSILMRMMAVRNGVGALPNVQEVEAKALSEKANLILEVLQTEDSTAPMGLSFRIDVKDMQSGSILANIISTGRPMPRARGGFVATNRGFQRPGPPPLTLETLGEQLAIETMAALADHWGRRGY